jgi:GDP-mannose 6-dehydrogenase
VILAERLLGKGFPLKIYDRSVNVANLMGSNRAYIRQEIPHLEELMVDTPEEALATSTLAIVGHVNGADRAAMIAALKDHAVFDLAGIEALRSHPGIDYRGFCW